MKRKRIKAAGYVGYPGCPELETAGVLRCQRERLEAADDSATKSQALASQAVQNAGAWSEAFAKRLETLVGSIESRTQEFAQGGEHPAQGQ